MFLWMADTHCMLLQIYKFENYRLTFDVQVMSPRPTAVKTEGSTVVNTEGPKLVGGSLSKSFGTHVPIAKKDDSQSGVVPGPHVLDDK